MHKYKLTNKEVRGVERGIREKHSTWQHSPIHLHNLVQICRESPADISKSTKFCEWKCRAVKKKVGGKKIKGVQQSHFLVLPLYKAGFGAVDSASANLSSLSLSACWRSTNRDVDNDQSTAAPGCSDPLLLHGLAAWWDFSSFFFFLIVLFETFLVWSEKQDTVVYIEFDPLTSDIDAFSRLFFFFFFFGQSG